MRTDTTHQQPKVYSVSYRYIDPYRGGPFRGRIDSDRRYEKGELIQGMFGRAIVKTCSVKQARKPASSAAHALYS